MEPTYYWDSLSRDAIDQLNAKTPIGRTVRFATFPTSWIHLKKTGRFQFGLSPIDPGQPRWYVVQNRPGEFQALETRLIRQFGASSVLVTKLGVPLIWAFPYDIVEATLKELERNRR